MIRVAVIDDEPLARSGVIARLAEQTDFQVVAEYADGVSGLEGIRACRPDLIFVDIEMPQMNGLVHAGKIKVRSVEKPGPQIVVGVVVKPY